MAANSNPLRQRLSTLLLLLAFVLTIVAGPALYVSAVIDDEDAFVSVADQVIAHPDVRQSIAESVTTLTFEAVAADEALAEVLPEQLQTFAVPITQIASSQLTRAAFRVLDTELAVDIRDSALREVHRQVTADSDEVAIDLRAVLVRTSREIGGPTIGAGVAKFVSDSDAGRFVLAEPNSSNSRLLEGVRAIPALGGLVGLAAVASLVLGMLLAPDRRRALVRGGLALGTGAVISTVVVSTLLFVVLSSFAGGSSIGLAVAEIVSADFAHQQRGVVVNGIVLAVIGLLLGNRPAAIALRRLPGDIWHRKPRTGQSVATIVGDNPPLARIVVWLGGVLAFALWSTPTTRVVTTIIILTAIGQLLVWLFTSSAVGAVRLRSQSGIASAIEETATPESHQRVRTNVAIATLLGFLLWPGWSTSLVLVFFVVGALSQTILDLPAARRLSRLDQPSEVEPARSLGKRHVFAAAVATLFAVIGFASTAQSAERAEASSRCNGHDELCERRIDEVVFAGSHNAMSSTDLGWDLAMQTGDIVAQLDHGVRALLIDALYWGGDGSLDGGNEGAQSAVIEAALGDDQPKPGTWLCHGFCALGASELSATLTEIDLWLETNPREVLLMVIQDEITTSDMMTAFDSSGLSSRVHTHVPGTPFPTLDELITSDERIIVYAENEGSADSWYQNAWETAFTETPFTYALRSEFSCAPNRGDDDNPLFLINHWLTTGIPVREAAAAVNSRSALLERVQACETDRGRLPTVLATDFVQTADLIAVVDELNGVSQ